MRTVISTPGREALEALMQFSEVQRVVALVANEQRV
jgi:hypothetical protein